MIPKISIFQLLTIFVIIEIITYRLTGQLPYLLDKVYTDPIIGIFMIVGLIIGITIHEASHAFVAYRLGDPTAKLEGRMTLNPMAHLDPIGTIALLFIGIGWGKPTPFDPFNLRNIKRDSALISVAGAASNFLIAIALSVPYLMAYYLQFLNTTLNTVYLYALSPIIGMNVLLGVFNLIPVAPLDGFKVLAGILPRGWYYDFMSMEKYGIFILLLLLFTGTIGNIISFPTQFIIQLLLPFPSNLHF